MSISKQLMDRISNTNLEVLNIGKYSLYLAPLMNMNLFFLRLLRKLGFLKRMDLHSSVKLNDRKFKIPIIKEMGMNNLMMDEFWMLDILKRIGLNEDDVFIDIGANVGQTLLKINAVYKDLNCVCVEPLTACHSYLEKLMIINNINNGIVYPYGLSDQEGIKKINIHFDEPADRSASFLDLNLPIVRSELIEMKKWDNLIEDCKIDSKKIAVVKLDTEGSELEILETMKVFLTENKPIIIFEILSTQTEARTNKILQLINSIPYILYRIEKTNLHFKSISKIDNVKSGIAEHLCDYLLIHERDTALVSLLQKDNN